MPVVVNFCIKIKKVSDKKKVNKMSDEKKK